MNSARAPRGVTTHGVAPILGPLVYVLNEQNSTLYDYVLVSIIIPLVILSFVYTSTIANVHFIATSSTFLSLTEVIGSCSLSMPEMVMLKS